MKCEDCKHGKYQEAGGLSWVACYIDADKSGAGVGYATRITQDEDTCEEYAPKDTKCS